MTIKRIDLTWIVVKDIEEAIRFYTETIGLKLNSYMPEFGWAELQGHEGGSRLGIGKASSEEQIGPGQNSVFTLSVDNIEEKKNELTAKGAEMVGEILDIPGIVKLQTGRDKDGNHFQLVESYPGHE